MAKLEPETFASRVMAERLVSQHDTNWVSPGSQNTTRRDRKPAAYGAMIVVTCWCGWSAIELDRLDGRVRVWTALATERDLLYSDRMICVIPGFEFNPIGRMFLGQRHVMMVAFRDTDVDAILTMPECPVRLIVTTSSQLPAADLERLRERFGVENVE
jgi:hypothetical protein